MFEIQFVCIRVLQIHSNLKYDIKFVFYIWINKKLKKWNDKKYNFVQQCYSDRKLYKNIILVNVIILQTSLSKTCFCFRFGSTFIRTFIFKFWELTISLLNNNILSYGPKLYVGVGHVKLSHAFWFPQSIYHVQSSNSTLSRHLRNAKCTVVHHAHES